MKRFIVGLLSVVAVISFVAVFASANTFKRVTQIFKPSPGSQIETATMYQMNPSLASFTDVMTCSQAYANAKPLYEAYMSKVDVCDAASMALSNARQEGLVKYRLMGGGKPAYENQTGLINEMKVLKSGSCNADCLGLIEAYIQKSKDAQAEYVNKWKEYTNTCSESPSKEQLLSDWRAAKQFVCSVCENKWPGDEMVISCQ